MENILEDINSVAGVTGSFVCNDEGLILAQSMPENFETAWLSPVGRTMAQTITGLERTHRRRVSDLDLLYHEGRLVVKHLRPGYLYILCVPTTNVPLLNLTANVAAKKLATMVKQRQEVVAKQAELQKAQAAHALMLNDEIRSIISTAREQGTVLRAAGDAAIRLRCPNATRTAPLLSDRILDLVGRANHVAQIGNVLESLGYSPERRFNVLRGNQRLRYTHPEKQLGIEVFLDTLNMYHQLSFVDRLDLDEDSIPLADVLLWKLQNVESDEDDLRAIYAIVYDHDLGGPRESETIDTTRILDLCANNWGWYKTVTVNLAKSIAFAESDLNDETTVFLDRARRLLQLIEEAPKSGGWQLRARIGEGRRWYEIPE